MNRLKAYLQLMRPPNLLTAVADVLGGVALSGFFATNSLDQYALIPVLLLCAGTVGLYGGGVVMNDVFDAELDQTERPERPIPSGRANKTGAILLATGLFIIGVLCAAMIGSLSVLYAGGIVVSALLYDKYAKPHPFWGPLLMGLCRGLNLLLGMSIAGYHMLPLAYIGIIPVVYIFAVTFISRGEVHGGHWLNLRISFLLYLLVLISLLVIAGIHHHLLLILPTVVLLAFMIFTPLAKALRQPVAANIGKSVKYGVLGIVVLDSAWALTSGDIVLALIILCLLPLSLLLAKLFAVT